MEALKESLAERTQTSLQTISRNNLNLLKEKVAKDIKNIKEVVEEWRTNIHVTLTDLNYMYMYIESTEKWILSLEERLEAVKDVQCEGCDSGHPGQIEHYGGCIPDPFGIL